MEPMDQCDLGNYSGPPPTFVDRPYNPATDFHLGYFGLDQANHKVWAVINHNSLFAAGIPFDLVSVVSRKTHGAAGNFDINLPLTGTPGVECRRVAAAAITRSSSPSRATSLTVKYP